jgi:NAD(P)H-hydrate epimerase
MKIVTAQEMQQIDRTTIEGYGLSGFILMERAGLSVAKRIKERFDKCPVVVLAGGGNNGGDGFVIARDLNNDGWHVKVFLCAKRDQLKGDALFHCNVAERFGVTVEEKTKIKVDELTDSLVVDAIVGTGLKKDVKAPLNKVIDTVNESGSPVVAVDIPSGISSDTGQIMGTAIKACITVTFGLPKRGHYLYPGCGFAGELFIEDIGFPKTLLESDQLRVELIEPGRLRALLPKRKRNAHKGNFGHVFLVAGSRGKTGAALMAAKAALRAGAGLVTIGIPESIDQTFACRVVEEMTLPLPCNNGFFTLDSLGPALKFLQEKASVLAIGPGLSSEPETASFVRALSVKSTVPVVIDADGINAFQKESQALSQIEVPCVITPHPGEMGRLTGMSARQTDENRMQVAVEFAKVFNVYVLLKGAPSVLACPDDKVFINPTGNPGMASAGTGDVLTGIIAGLIAQGIPAVQGAKLGVYLHGLSGDIAAAKKTEVAMTAGDILECLPEAMKQLGIN